ncbi:MAG: S-adenosylmethionine decarboxylase family protein [Candidatus Marinamargulisbacteria bacterium]
MPQEKGFGPHLMLDLNQCNEQALDSLITCFQLLDELPNHIGMTKITQPHVFPYDGLVPEDRGITGTVIIAESHISIHTFPLKSYAFIDVFSCKPFNVDAAVAYCIGLFDAKDPDIHLTQRGRQFPSGSSLGASVPVLNIGT